MSGKAVTYKNVDRAHAEQVLAETRGTNQRGLVLHDDRTRITKVVPQEVLADVFTRLADKFDSDDILAWAKGANGKGKSESDTDTADVIVCALLYLRREYDKLR